MTGSLVRALGCSLRIPALAALGGLAIARGQTLVGDSPFLAPGTAAGASSPAEAYELAGSTVQGADVTVCIFERQAKKSRWIPVGGTEDGIKVLSYDSSNDKVVVAVNGSRKELFLRHSAVTTQSPSYAFTKSPPSGSSQVAALVPIEPVTPATPEAQANDQREARMLVSDLLEIGVQQRKAYQDAKQKAASETPTQPTN